MKMTPEQLLTFASAGWSPEAIKEMLDYDTEVKAKLENNEDVKPEDGTHINEDPQPQKKEEVKDTENGSAEDILEKMFN